MDELEEYSGDSKGVNFIPCLKFIQRGVAKSQPDKVCSNIHRNSVQSFGFGPAIWF